MLVLTRKSGEAIVIGNDVEIRVVGVRGQKVRLAIDAPASLSVNRKEVQEAIRDGTWDLRERRGQVLGKVHRGQRVG